jgi:hypothetical protein
VTGRDKLQMLQWECRSEGKKGRREEGKKGRIKEDIVLLYLHLPVKV